MRNQFIIPLLVLFATILCCSNVFAYKVKKTKDGKTVRWKTNTIIYYVNTSGGPSGSLTAIQSAMQTWTDVNTSSLRFVYGGNTTSTAYNLADGMNIICFRSLGTETTTARNFVTWNASGEIQDSDIVVNTDHNLSAADACPKDRYDIQSIVTHELGHALILCELKKKEHRKKTMYWKEFKGDMKKRTLEQDDINGIAYLYP